MIPPDKIAHFALSLVLIQNLYFLIKSYSKINKPRLMSFLLTLVLVYIKELNDPVFGIEDMLANYLGIFVGSVLLNLYKNKEEK